MLSLFTDALMIAMRMEPMAPRKTAAKGRR